ncbi:hypothetical protein NW762_009240 [Fusarium torreyae]|uniref:Uncharacterized protein n=1 Tax=Fusarium torreyae TaxID=1237075 RepID=A0A9W8RY40_9HYPO|nr:hypothetical protein NW762_009240 [Fusarium torreyae]
MPLPPTLTGLPCEIRTAIFGYYFQLDGGYIFNAESERLVDANGQPIDLSLMYACRSIANDTKDLPFSVNAVSFSTFYSPCWRAWAGRFEYLSTLHYFLQLDFLTYLGQFITVEIYSVIENKFPGFGTLLKMRIDHCQEYRSRLAEIEAGNGVGGYPENQDSEGLECDQHGPGNRTEEGSENNTNNQRPPRPPQDLEFVKIRGHADSYRDSTVYHSRYHGIYNAHKSVDMCTWCRVTQLPIMREAVAYSLRLVAKQQESKFTMLIRAALPRWSASHSPQEIHDLHLDQWTIPSQSSLAKMGGIYGDDPLWQRVQGWHNIYHEYPLPVVNYREKFRFSAAAAAIRCLSHLQDKVRMRLRKVVLVEDQLAVADPSSHAVGLIHFCQENTRLKVERRLK